MPAVAAASPTVYSPGTATVDGVLNGPWDASQGDPTAGSSYPFADLFPFIPGGPTVTGGFPNVAVYPGATTPLPSGDVGTPGPLQGYCLGGTNNETATVKAEPSSTDLPMSPYYFPYVVRNADGSLTGYFDYRPKDADESIVVAKSTDFGHTWSVVGTALDQNQGYCPTSDANDDGQGHPFVMSVGGTARLYTLQRQAGDYNGVGLLVHGVSPSASNPLTGVPTGEAVGVDPNTFAQASAIVPTTGNTGVPIAVSTLGSANSPDQIVAGPYEDLSAPSPYSTLITCTGTATGPNQLTGCTVAGSGSYTVHSGDDLVQVIATANPGTGNTYTIPHGPNSAGGGGGLGTVALFSPNSSTAPNTTTESPITTFIMNNNAPNRVYIDGSTVYCVQANANPTTKIENCTTTNPAGLTVHQGDAITADPIQPTTAQMTSGLVAPDGIVGTIPTYPGAPHGSTVALYTEKLLNYFIVGTTNGSVSASNAYTAGAVALAGAGTVNINYTPSVLPSEPLPASGSFTIYLGTTVAGGIQTVTCSSWQSAATAGTTGAVPAGSINLMGCTGGTGNVAAGNWIGGPNASIEPYSVLSQTGEGSNSTSKGPQKLFGNNEDYTVLRAAYTTDGVNFTDLGSLSDPASATSSTCSASATSNNGTYTGLSDPYQQCSPTSSASPSTPALAPSAPTNIAPGASDQVEMRWIGSRGSIITNPDGSLGMFLSGAWASDGDSDAFNQTFYTTSTNGGQTWSTPIAIVSSDYTFSASANESPTGPLGVSAYYSGRAYGPSVVQNPDGTLTLVFAGYRLPKPITAAGVAVGTVSGHQYTVASTDPALYRNILTETLNPVQQSQTVSFSGTPPTLALQGGTYTPSATATSGLTPTLTIDSSSASVCSINGGGTVTFNAGGTCKIDANQAGNIYYSAAAQQQEQITVAGDPTAAISSPPDGQTFSVGEIVPTSFSCAEGTNGTGLVSCSDSNHAASPNGQLDTSHAGNFTYTVTATSADGLTGTTSISYSVVAGSGSGAPVCTPSAPQYPQVGQATELVTVTSPNGFGTGAVSDVFQQNGSVATYLPVYPNIDTMQVVATKVDQSKGTSWAFAATDLAGHTTYCA